MIYRIFGASQAVEGVRLNIVLRKTLQIKGILLLQITRLRTKTIRQRATIPLMLRMELLTIKDLTKTGFSDVVVCT